MKWIEGRQKTGYSKIPIFESLRFDLHLLKYPTGVGIPRHVDETPGYKHYRINIASTKDDCFNGPSIIRTPRFNFFRSDQPHEVLPVTKLRYVLSIGIRI